MMTTATQKQTKRLRSKKSCLTCRQRKVRCDVDDTYPCSTCIKKKVECHVNERRRPKKATPDYLRKIEGRINRLEQKLISKGVNLATSSTKDNASTTLISQNASSSPTSSSPVSSTCSGSRSHKDERESHLQIASIDPSNTIHDPEYTSSQQLQVVDVNQNHSDMVINSDRMDTATSADDGSSCFGDTNISRWKQHRLNLFNDIPLMTLELADAMIEFYFRHVHPVVPIINKIEFLRQYYFQYPHAPDEYLLYSMCAITCHFIIKEKDLVTKCKVTANTIRSLHCCLESKASKVLESIFRKPSISGICALLLLASVNHKSQAQEDNRLQWLMCGTAIRIAQDLGFHDSERQQHLAKHEVELRRRIWFYAYCTDREISFGTKRPWMIVEGDYDFEMPTPYEVPANHHGWTADVDTPMPILLLEAEKDLHEQRPIYDIFIYCIPFTQLFSQIVGHLYSTSIWGHEIESQIHVARLLSREVDAITNNTMSILRQLDATSLPEPADRIKYIYLFTMNQLSLKLLIHRLFTSNDEMAHTDFGSHSLQVCTEAAIGIIDIMEKLEIMGPSNMPWIYIGGVIMQAASVFTIHAESDNGVLKLLGSQNLARCASIYLRDDEQCGSRPAQILKSLAAKYSSSDTMQQHGFGYQTYYAGDSTHGPGNEQRQQSFRSTPSPPIFTEQYPLLIYDASNNLETPASTAFIHSSNTVSEARYGIDTTQQLQPKATVSTTYQTFDDPQERGSTLQFKATRDTIPISAFMSWDEWDSHLQ